VSSAPAQASCAESWPRAGGFEGDDDLDKALEALGLDEYRPGEDGLIPLIIALPEGADRDRLIESCQGCPGGRITEELPLVNGLVAELPASHLRQLVKNLPPGARIALNRDIEFPDPRKLSAGTPGGTVGEKYDPPTAVLGIDKVWEKGFTGKGQTIAIIDSGIYPHPDLKDKVVGWVDLAENRLQPYDSFGHGTHVAGLAAGSGARSAGRLAGAAPDASLVGIRITTVAEAIKALQWVIENKDKYNIKVVNMSLGDFATRSYKDDPWAQAAEKAIQAGLVVVVAAGNEGPDPGTISTPGTDPQVITVGALDDRHTRERSDDAVAGFSSRGPTPVDNLAKPDVLAPGVSVFGPLAPGTTLDVPELPHLGKDYIAISGTSMATPVVSGLVADLLQANPALTHQDVKDILQRSAVPYLQEDRNAQGAGVVDAQKALELALNWPPAASRPAGLLPAPHPPAGLLPAPRGEADGFLFA
jgi:serine protease AprX